MAENFVTPKSSGKHGVNKTHFQNPAKTYTALTRFLHHTSRDLQ